MRPTFLVIGAAKSATTTLCHLLGTHPEVFMSPRKEPHFFSADMRYDLGTEWYEAWFDGAEGCRAIGEGSASYTSRAVFPNAAERIAEYEPRMRLIFIVRHPLDRMVSLWMQLRRLSVAKEGVVNHPKLRVDLSFDRAIREQREVLVDSTNYWQEIAPYRERFADDQLLVLLFEELRRDPAGVLARCFEFLGVDPTFELPTPDAHLNSMREYTHPRPIFWRLWGSPRRSRAYIAFANLFPRQLRRWIGRRILRTSDVRRPEWAPETASWAWSRVGADNTRFLEHYGFPTDTWKPPDEPTSASELS